MSVKWNLNQSERDGDDILRANKRKRNLDHSLSLETDWPGLKKSYRKSRQLLNESTYSSFEATQPWSQLSQVERKDCIFCGYSCLSQLLLETSRRFESAYFLACSSYKADSSSFRFIMYQMQIESEATFLLDCPFNHFEIGIFTENHPGLLFIIIWTGLKRRKLVWVIKDLWSNQLSDGLGWDGWMDLRAGWSMEHLNKKYFL